MEGIVRLMFSHWLRNIKGFLIPEQDTYDHSNGKTVVLSPGFTCTPSAMKELGDELREYFNVVYSPIYPRFNTWPVRQSSALLAQKLQEITQYVHDGDINVIGHSLGGLIAVEAVKMASWMRVDNVLALSTPFRGTKTAQMLQNVFPACKDMSEPYGYLNNTKIGDKLHWKLIAHVSEMDSVVPAFSQIPQKTIAHWKIQVVRHKDFDHGNFVIGSTVKKVAEVIYNNCK